MDYVQSSPNLIPTVPIPDGPDVASYYGSLVIRVVGIDWLTRAGCSIGECSFLRSYPTSPMCGGCIFGNPKKSLLGALHLKADIFTLEIVVRGSAVPAMCRMGFIRSNVPPEAMKIAYTKAILASYRGVDTWPWAGQVGLTVLRSFTISL